MILLMLLSTDEDIGSLLGENYGEVLKMGFLMNWTAHNCSTCESSGGRWGYEFNCSCRDRRRLKSCDAGNCSSNISFIPSSLLCIFSIS